MPEFILNKPAASHPFYSLDDFARGYVEAMFFTNGDTGDEREDLLNEWGVERLTRASVAAIKADCDRFRRELPRDLHGRTPLDLAQDYAPSGYSDEQAGRDFWFSRQGHGAGFFDRGLGAAGDRLQEAARAFGECQVEAWRGWIYVR